MNRRCGKTVQQHRLRPRVFGAGLVALDVVVNLSKADEKRYFAGGTCANVLAILSYLGWDACPIGRLKNNLSAKQLVEDLAKWDVDTSLISRTDDGSTPIIIQYIRDSGDGTRTHSFSLRCPCCGAYLPGYKSILGRSTDDITNRLAEHQVYFFDRVSRGTLNLANAAADRGAVVFFEPSGVGDPRLFREAWGIAHVVKYSNERLPDIADLDLSASATGNVLLEIQTLGDAGLRFHSHLRNVNTRGWRSLEVIPAPIVRDTAGAGDWCTAGVIHKLARDGQRGLRQANEKRLMHAFRFGQALASWNCSFESPRGGMYGSSRPEFERQIRRLLDGKSLRVQTQNFDTTREHLSKICPSCEAAEFSACIT